MICLVLDPYLSTQNTFHCVVIRSLSIDVGEKLRQYPYLRGAIHNSPKAALAHILEETTAVAVRSES